MLCVSDNIVAQVVADMAGHHSSVSAQHCITGAHWCAVATTRRREETDRETTAATAM